MIDTKERVRHMIDQALALADNTIETGKIVDANAVREIIHKLGEAIRLLAA
jgi:hypothetical protein